MGFSGGVVERARWRRLGPAAAQEPPLMGMCWSDRRAVWS